MISEVFNTDCLEYMRTLPDKAFQLAIADPPYGGAKETVGRTGGTWAAKYGTHINEWDKAPEQEFFDELSRVSENQIIWGANYFTMPPTRCFIVWKKHIPEDFTMSMCEYAWTSFNANAKVCECSSLGTKDDPRFHPTQKPVDLYAFCLKHYAKPGDRIFDPMMGSQSSRIAAYKMGFDYVGCELDKEYFDKGCERFNRECKGEIVTKDGNIVKQMSLFGDE